MTPTPTPAIPLATRVTSAIPSITRVTSAISSVTRATPAIPSVTPAAPVIPKRPSPLPLVPDLPGFAKSEIYQLYMKLTAHLKEPDWIDMISMEFLKGHPAFTQPPPDRHKVPLWDSVRNPSLGELLASEQGVRHSTPMLCLFLMHFLRKSGMNICRRFGGRKLIGRIKKWRKLVGRDKY